MSIFSRLTDIVNSNINSILDRSQDPEKIIRLIIQEMEDTLVEVRSGAVRAIAERKEIERKIEGLRRERDEWERRAEFAVTKGREDLAKGALLAKARCGQSLEALERQLAQIADGLAKQNEDIGKLQAKLVDAKARERSLAARQKSAAGRLKIRSKLYDERITDAFARFEQVERSLDELEGKVEAYDLGRGGTAGTTGAKTVAEEFAGLEAEASVEDELAALKKRLGNSIKHDTQKQDAQKQDVR